MKFEAKIESNGKKIFESSGEKAIEEVLIELDAAIQNEIKRK